MYVCLQMLTFQNQPGSLSDVTRISKSHNDHFTSARMVAANVNTANLYNQNHKNCLSSVLKCLSSDTLAEWLRRRPAKPMGSPRAGSNPAGVALEIRSSLSSVKRTRIVCKWRANATPHKNLSVQIFIPCKSRTMLLSLGVTKHMWYIAAHWNQQMRPVRIALTTLGLWDPRATNCAIAAIRE